MRISDRISFTVEEPDLLDVALEDDTTLGFEVDGFSLVNRVLPAYEGPLEVTPATQRQVLATDTRSVYGDIVIDAIPSNYGRITWDGSKITVS